MSDLTIEQKVVKDEELFSEFRNYAGNIDVEVRVKEEILPIITNLEDEMASLVDRWNENWDIWGLKERNPKYEGRSKVYDPITRDAVETIVGVIMRNLFSSLDPFETKAMSAEIDEDLRKRVHQLLKYFLHRARIKRKIEMFLRHLVITGTGILKVYWKEEQKKIWTKEKRIIKTPEGLPEEIVDIVEKVIIDGYAEVDVIDPRDFIIYPSTAMNIEDAVLVCEKIRLSWSDLKRGEAQGIYHNVDRIKQLEEKQKRENESLYESEKGLPEFQSGKPFYMIYEIWTDFDIEGNGKEVPCVITIGPGNIVLRVQRNPFWHQSPPYVYTQFIPDGTAYGEGIIDAVKEIQRELNERRTVQGDTFSLTLNPIFCIPPRQKKVLPFIQVGPGKIWPVAPGEIDTVKPPADIIQLAEMAIKRMRDEIKEYTRVTSVLAGQPTGGTATETAILQSNLQLPFAIQTENIENNVLNEVLRLFYELAKQFITEDYSFIVTGSREPITVKYEELLDQFKFEWQGMNRLGNVLFRADRIGMFLRIINEAKGIPGFEAILQKIDFEKLLRRYWENLDMKDTPFKGEPELPHGSPPAPALVAPPAQGMAGAPTPAIPPQEIEGLAKEVLAGAVKNIEQQTGGGENE